MKKEARHFRPSDGGSVAILAALMMIPLAGLVGAAVDYSHASSQRADAQKALDAAVIAGLVGGAPDIVRAREAFEAALPAGARDVVADFTPGAGRLVGTASFATPTTISRVIGFNEIRSNIAAEAAVDGSRVCILVLDETGPQPLLVNSGADVEASRCEIHVRGRRNPASIFNPGADLDFARICIAGERIIDNGADPARLELGCDAAQDPFAGTLPSVDAETCDFNAGNHDGGTVTLLPGTYCGWRNFNAGTNVILQPGLYVIKDGGWNVNGGRWTGDGVTFYFADTSKIQFNSGIDAELSAPRSGSRAGILIYETPGLPKSQFILNTSQGNDLEGLIWLPSRELVFNSDSKFETDQMTMVVDRLILNDTRWRVDPNPDHVVTAGGGTAPRLVR